MLTSGNVFSILSERLEGATSTEPNLNQKRKVLLKDLKKVLDMLRKMCYTKSVAFEGRPEDTTPVYLVN